MWRKSISTTSFLPIQILVILQISYGKPSLKPPHFNSTLSSAPPLLIPDMTELELDANSSESGALPASSSTYSETLSVSLTVLPFAVDNDTLAESSSNSFTSASGNDSIANSSSSTPLEPEYYEDINGNSSASSSPTEVEDEADAELVHFLGSTTLPMEESSSSSDDLMAVAGSLDESVTVVHSLSTESSNGSLPLVVGDEVEVADESIIIAASVVSASDPSNLNVDLVEHHHQHHSPPTQQLMIAVNADEMQRDIIISTSSEPSPPSQ